MKKLLFLLIFTESIFCYNIKNPLNTTDSITPRQLININLSSRSAGTIDKPNTVPVSFKIVDKNNIIYPGLKSHNFEYTVYNSITQKQIAGPVTVFSKDRYICYLPLPSMATGGWYNLRIKLKGYNKILDTKIVKKAFFYNEEKINLVFIIDNSGSMLDNDPAGYRFKAVKQIINQNGIKEYLNKIAVISFSDKGEIALGFTSVSEKEKIEKALSRRFLMNFTNIPDGLIQAYNLISSTILKYKTIVIFLTDGVSSYPYRDEHKLFEASSIPVFTIGLTSTLKKEYDENFLRNISQSTGGQFFNAQTDIQITDLYGKIVADSIKMKQNIIIYNLDNAYDPQQLITAKVLVRNNYEKSSLKISIDNQPCNILYYKKDPVTEIGIFPPSKQGTHLITTRVYINRGIKKTKNQYIKIQSVKNTYTTDLDSFSFENAEKKQLSHIYFTIANKSNEDKIIQFEFYPIFNSNNVLMPEYFTVFNNPFYLKKNAAIKKNISIIAPERISSGLFSGYCTIAVGNKKYIHNITVDIKENLSYHGSEFINFKNSSIYHLGFKTGINLRRFLSDQKIIVIISLWLFGIIITYITLSRIKKSNIFRN